MILGARLYSYKSAVSDPNVPCFSCAHIQPVTHSDLQRHPQQHPLLKYRTPPDDGRSSEDTGLRLHWVKGRCQNVLSFFCTCNLQWPENDDPLEGYRGKADGDARGSGVAPQITFSTHTLSSGCATSRALACLQFLA